MRDRAKKFLQDSLHLRSHLPSRFMCKATLQFKAFGLVLGFVSRESFKMIMPLVKKNSSFSML
jgi:hypothetical protein